VLLGFQPVFAILGAFGLSARFAYRFLPGFQLFFFSECKITNNSLQLGSNDVIKNKNT